MSFNRRSFLRTGAAAAVLGVAPRPLLAFLGASPEPVPPIDDPRLAALAARALDSAKSAGATYADVRLTHTKRRSFLSNQTGDEETMEVGVRTLVNGFWGFASGPVWSPDEMARLGREAVHQSKANGFGKVREVSLAPTPVVPNGNWNMPVQIDPFELSPFEVEDYLQGLKSFVGRTARAKVSLSTEFGSDIRVDCQVQDKAFASTVGTYVTQRAYRTGGVVAVTVSLDARRAGTSGLACATPAGMGWELFVADRIPRVRDNSLADEIVRRVDEMREELLLPIKPVQVGRYDSVFDAAGVATLLDQTLGRATQLDRAMGYEANGGGTSYVSDPLHQRGAFTAGSPLVSVTGNRSESGAVATVKWDDEGVTPDESTLVKDGVLADFQTTRESAGWLKARSHGCANAPSGIEPPLQHTPNLVMAPRDGGDFNAMVGNLSDGIAIKGIQLSMDFQCASGLGFGQVFSVKGGKRVARLADAGFLFRATDLWKSVATVGAESHLQRIGLDGTKGEPAQTCWHSVTAVPATVKGLTIIDVLRKA
ncbi:MAG TPA: metallopeptidase TldD-related protein [Gemmatimonadaceae bacterium]|nr:metallopeptidase TldD-related protein [Gemmatimonadaceae bacterium]